MKKILVTTKFGKDVLWNIVCFGGMILIGILINLIIIRWYDEAALGIFNQVYAVYIFLSQLAVGGVHLAVQYFVPKYSYSSKTSVYFLLTALFSSLITSLLVILVGYSISEWISELLKSREVKMGLDYTLWGLLFFSFNKIILSYLNGLRRMIHFAFFQLIRFVNMLVVLIIYVIYHLDSFYLPSILALAELFLFLMLIVFVFPEIRFIPSKKKFKSLFLLQFYFGNKALLGNFLLDLNTKVDVFMLGIFLDDVLVGVYSFSATLFEGFSQIAVLLRNNFNPILTRAFNNKSLFEKVVRRNVRTFYKWIGLLGLISILLFPIIPFLFSDKNILKTSIVYAILCLGFIFTGGYQVLMMIFNQIGYPKVQTLLIFLVFLSNVVFNLIFIPLFSIYGAALGTSLSFIVLMVLIQYIFKAKFNIKLTV